MTLAISSTINRPSLTANVQISATRSAISSTDNLHLVVPNLISLFSRTQLKLITHDSHRGYVDPDDRADFNSKQDRRSEALRELATKPLGAIRIRLASLKPASPIESKITKFESLYSYCTSKEVIDAIKAIGLFINLVKEPGVNELNIRTILSGREELQRSAQESDSNADKAALQAMTLHQFHIAKRFQAELSANQASVMARLSQDDYESFSSAITEITSELKKVFVFLSDLNSGISTQSRISPETNFTQIIAPTITSLDSLAAVTTARVAANIALLDGIGKQCDTLNAAIK